MKTSNCQDCIRKDANFDNVSCTTCIDTGSHTNFQSIEDLLTLNAIGYPIMLGERYGYSSNINGIIRVITGTASKLQANKVKLTDLTESQGLYGEITTPPVATSGSKTVYSRLVFKI